MYLIIVINAEKIKFNGFYINIFVTGACGTYIREASVNSKKTYGCINIQDVWTLLILFK